MNGHTNQTARCGRDPLQFISRIIKGAVVGVGAILPGISGGVLSVVYGIYRPLLEFLAHPENAWWTGCSANRPDPRCGCSRGWS